MSSGNIAGAYPLSPLQEGMLFHLLREPRKGLYVIQYTCRIRGLLDVERLREAWLETTKQHAVLRTLFSWERRERPLQVVRERVELPFELVDWRDRDAATQEESFADWRDRERELPFDLGQAPLFRLGLARLGDGEHRFLWTVHHMLLDGWGGRLVLDEVQDRYEALVSGRSYAPPSAPEFAHYVHWLQQQDLVPAEQFWRETLRGFDAATPRPLDPARPASALQPLGREPECVHRSFTLSANATRALDEACRRHRVTLNTLTLAAWSLLLEEQSNESDVLFGVSVVDRPAEIQGIENVVGLLLNTVPMRLQVDFQSDLSEWLRGVQTRLGQMRAHEHAPLVEIQRWSPMPAGEPLFETVVAFEHFARIAERETATVRIEDEILRDRSSYPMALLVFPGEEFQLTLVDADERFSDEGAASLLRRLAALLEGLADRSVQRVGHVARAIEALETTADFVPSTDAARSASSIPIDVVERFEAQVRAVPERIAIATETEQLSFEEVDRRANQLAWHLRECGVRPGSFVPLLLERDSALLIAMWAVLKAGGAYVPFAVRTPANRRDQMLDDLRTANGGELQILVARTEDWDDLDAEHLLPLTEIKADLARRPTHAPERADEPNQPAYVIYTSGSTGRPKGVVVERENLAYSTAARLEYYAEPPSAFLLLSSPAVDSSVAGIYWALCAGATLVLPPDRIEQNVDRLVDILREKAVSHTLLLPSLYRVLLEVASPGALAGLGCVVVAGEECPADLVALHEEQVGCALYNEYGPAEATVWVTADRLSTREAGVTIGRAVPGTAVYVLDDRGERCAPGAPGEIFVAGPGVAKGYLGREDLSAERFLADPFESGSRMYRTGDRGRWLCDGRLDYLGRVDRQVKLLGYRVELGEIERALEAHPEIQEAGVIVASRQRGASSVAALVDRLAELDRTTADALIRETEAATPGELRGTTG